MKNKDINISDSYKPAVDAIWSFPDYEDNELVVHFVKTREDPRINILKEIEDLEFAQKAYPDHEVKWFWGLGEDGQLYAKCIAPGNEVGIWERFPNPYSIMHKSTINCFTIREMKLIVKTFGNLLLFI